MALTREQFDKLRASGLSTEQIINFERGYVPEKKETFLQGLGRDIASPFIRGAELVGSAASLTGSGIKSMAQNALGDKAGAKETAVNAFKKAQERTTAKVNVFGREEAPITTTKQAVGAGLEVGSNLIGGGAAKNIFQNGIRTGIKTLAKQGSKAGLASGSMYGAGTALKENGNFGDVLKSSAIGGATGLVGGAVLAPVIGLGEKAAYRLTNTGIKAVKNVTGQINKKIKGVVTADDIEKELFNIENNYAKTRKTNSFSKDGGSETRKRLVSADVLSDVTDDTGTIRTLGENGAKAQYKLKTIDGIERLVKETLVKEGKTVSPEVLEGKMINDIMNSGLEGRALITSLNNVKGEIEGLMLRATPDGQIPLDVIHDAKISTADLAFKNIDPGIKKEGKSFAGSYKRIIEETSDEPIEAINKELQKDYKVLELLDVLDGKKVKGGKLGKYFAQIGGNIVGGAAGSVGGPVGSAAGTIIGGEIAGKIKGQMLKNTFGQSIGSTIEKSGILVEASNKVKAPRLLLPAPKPGSPLKSYGSGPTINLPAKTQSTLDSAYSYNLGKRNTMYNTTNTTTKTPIKLKSNNNTSSITPVNKKVKPLPKGKGETLKTTTLKSKPTPIEEFKNFKRDLTLQGQDKIIQEKSIEKFIKNKQKLVDEYIKDNGLVANTDNARKLFSDVGYTGGNSAAVHEASSALNKLVWKKTLKLAKNLEAILFSGGSGSGKSSVAEQFIRGLKKGNSAVLDSNLSGYNSAVASIAETLKAKKVARIVYIYREPVDAFIGTIKRMLTNPKEGGRLVPIKITAGNHPDSLGVVKKIYEEYGDLIAKKKLKFTFINNSNGAGKAVKMDYNKVKNIKLPNDLESQMKKALDKIYKDGVIIKGKKYKITKEQYNQLIK